MLSNDSLTKKGEQTMEIFDFASELEALEALERKPPEYANLPLDDYVDYLLDRYNHLQRLAIYHHDYREQLQQVRATIREAQDALLRRLDSFPMDERSVRTLLKLLFSLHFSYT